MANSLEQVQERFNNISSVEPLLDALRTISLGSWQQAINKRDHLERYHLELQAMLQSLIPQLKKQFKTKSRIEKQLFQNYSDEKESVKKNLLIVIGSERGLCGNFNGVVAEKVKQIIDESQDEQMLEVWAVGSRLERYLKRHNVNPSKIIPFSQGSLPVVRDSFALIQQVIQSIDEYDQVRLVYNHYLSVTSYVPKQQQLLPFDLPSDELLGDPSFEETIIESDPVRLIQQVTQQLLVFNLYDVLMKSATAEHATRFSLMEEASQNAERLMDDINQEYQALRRQIITREMIELASGAGLIN